MTNNQGATYALPNELDPPLDLCVQLTIPNDAQYYQLLWSILNNLSYWFAWDRDAAHSGRVVAKTWAAIRDSLQVCTPPPPQPGGLLEDFEMPLRVDCDCNVFVTCCDGTEKQILTADQVQAFIGKQPGPGTGVPSAGACMTYKATIAAGGAWFLPPLLNTGDTIDCTLFGGSTTEAAPLGRWNCETGLQFLGGICTGFASFNAGAPRPDLPLGVPLLQIGSNYFDATVPITVPSGVVNAPGALVINYPSGGSYAGDLTCTVQICNNQTPSACYSLDFSIDSGGFTIHHGDTGDPEGVWIPGTGFEALDARITGSNYQHVVDIVHTVPSVTITHLDMQYDLTKGSYHDPSDDAVLIIVNGSPVQVINHSSAVDGAAQHLVWDGLAVATEIRFVVSSSIQASPSFSGDCAITGLQICYEGPTRPT